MNSSSAYSQSNFRKKMALIINTLTIRTCMKYIFESAHEALVSYPIYSRIGCPLLLWYNGKDREVGFNYDTEFELKQIIQIENKVKSSSVWITVKKIFGVSYSNLNR
jgi:hypothetical protein